MNNWYIRRSRDRFWSPSKPKDDSDKQDAYDTLFTVLENLCRLSAPFLPMVTEEIFKGLTGQSSVHESDWPSLTEFTSDTDLVESMDLIRDIVSTTLRLREDASLRVRLPLQKITIAGIDSDALSDFELIIKDEVNVKAIVFTSDLEAHGTFVLKPDGKTLGPRLGNDVQSVFQSAKNGDWEILEGEKILINDYVLEPSEFDLSLAANEGTTAASLPGNKAIIVIDTAITSELVNEGKARDSIRAIQEARKSMGLVLTDRIHVNINASSETATALESFSDYICEQVLGKSLTFNQDNEDHKTNMGSIDGEEVSIQIAVD